MSNAHINALVALSDTDVSKTVCKVLKQRDITSIIEVESTYQAIDEMHKRLFNLFIVDARVPVTLERSATLYGGIDYIRFIRMCVGNVSEANVIFLRTHVGSQNLLESRSEIIEAQDAGASCVLLQPFTLQKFDDNVQPLISTPPVFIRAGTYTGPCRRKKAVAVEVDRRKKP